MDPGDRHQAEAERRRAVPRRIMPLAKGGQGGGQRPWRHARPKLQIGQVVDGVGRWMTIVDRQRRKGRPAGDEHLDVQMGVGRDVLEHRHHPHRVEGGDRRLLVGGIAEGRVLGRIQLDRAADRGVLAEVLAGHLAGQHQPVGGLHGGVGVARQHRVGHHPEEVRPDPGRRFRGGDLASLQEQPRRAHPGGVLHLGKIEPERSGQRSAGEDHGHGFLAGHGHVRFQAIGALVAGQEPLEGVLVAQVQTDHDGRGEADRQAQDGDAGIEPVAGEVVQRGGQIVAEHGPLPEVIRI